MFQVRDASVKSWSTVQTASTKGWNSIQTYVGQNPENLNKSYSGGGYGSINEPTQITMKQEESEEDFWAWGETSKPGKQQEAGTVNQESSKMVNNGSKNGSSSNLQKQSSSDFDESWGWEDEFTAKPKTQSSSVNGKKPSKAKKNQNSWDTNGWSEEGNDDWGQVDSWSNEDWSSVTPKKNTRQTIRSAGNGKKGD